MTPLGLAGLHTSLREYSAWAACQLQTLVRHQMVWPLHPPFAACETRCELSALWSRMVSFIQVWILGVSRRLLLF